MNLAHWLERAGRARPDAPALLLGERVVADYATFATRVARIAGGLRAAGVARDGRVAILSKNMPEYLDALFAIWWAGAAAVPINAKLHPVEAAYILGHAEVDAVIASTDLAGDIADHLPSARVRLIEIGGPDWARLLAADVIPIDRRGPDDLAWLFYTSGTTGRPKGAMLTHRNLMAMSFAYLTAVDPTAPGEVVLHAAPMSHGSGLYALPHIAALGANAVPESGAFDTDETARLLSRLNRPSLFAAPTMIRRLIDVADRIETRNIRTIVWGGAPMHVADVKRAIDALGPCLAQIYGQGETPMTATVLSKAEVADRAHPRWEARIGSAGRASPIVEVAIDAPLGEAGEILVAGDTVMASYWRDEAATARAIRDGWLHTGDVGAIDADGYVTLMDRSKDLIISGGSNIYPREVEEVLLRHPAVREVSVIGRPDPEWGEIVVAYVVGDAPAGELDALCLASIARFKRPKAYVALDALPKNAYGKILKTELRARDAAAKTKTGEGA